MGISHKAIMLLINLSGIISGERHKFLSYSYSVAVYLVGLSDYDNFSITIISIETS